METRIIIISMIIIFYMFIGRLVINLLDKHDLFRENDDYEIVNIINTIFFPFIAIWFVIKKLASNIVNN